MYSNIKNEIKEIIKIVNECPPSLQERCFEVLLSHLLMENSPASVGEAPMPTPAPVAAPTPIPEPEPEPEPVPEPVKEEIPNGKTVKKKVAEPVPVEVPEPEPVATVEEPSKGIRLNDFHDKVQNFLEAGSISIERINEIYAKEDGAIFPVYTDLATDEPRVVQICLGLLTAFESSFFTGVFEFSVDTVRARCKEMKSYDAENFRENFENVSQLFEEGAEFKKGHIAKLSSAGMMAVLEVLGKIK